MSRDLLAKAMAAYKAGDLSRAAEMLDVALKGIPTPPSALLALYGNVHYRLKNYSQAADAFLAAAREGGAEAPQFVELAVNLFGIAGRSRPISENIDFLRATCPQSPTVAYACCKVLLHERRLVELAPSIKYLNRDDDAHLGLLVQCYRLTNQLGKLIEELKAILAKDPARDSVRMLLYFTGQDACDYDLQRERDAYLASLDEAALSRFLSFEPLHGRLFRSEDERVNTLPGQQTEVLNAIKVGRDQRRAMPQGKERISIGYLSSDFHSHATMVLLGEALNHHDESRFEITLFCYTAAYAAADQERWPEKLRKWIVPVRDLSDEAVAQMIDERGIDILVDLKGLTLNTRSRIVNLCRAPVKVSYLGYPGSIPELDYDYIIGDPVVTPDAFKDIYPEKLCRLPDSYQANNSTWRQKPAPVARADFNLPEDAFIFASFNQPIKLTERTIDLWSSVLKRTPDAVLWTMASGDLRQHNLRNAFVERGVAADRIIFASQVAFAEHVSRIPLADVALDTFPCNGHTTTSDALWAGLPVITILGKSFAARVSASLLNAAGLSELVADTDEAFIDMAVALANDPERLKIIRTHLIANRETLPLYDTRRFTANLEQAYTMMAERARKGLPPDHIDVVE